MHDRAARAYVLFVVQHSIGNAYCIYFVLPVPLGPLRRTRTRDGSSSSGRVQRTRYFDVPGAYLQGDQYKSERRLYRPPVGFRKFDKRGVEILWLT